MDNYLPQEIRISNMDNGRHELNKSIFVIKVALLFLYSASAFADRYGLCEPPECGGGGNVLDALVGIVLVGGLIAIMSGAQKVIFISAWLGVVALSFALGYKGFAIFWAVIGFWPAFFLTSWLSEKIEFSNSKSNQVIDQSKQEKN